MPGLYELRIGTEILYTDEQGNYLIQGHLIDTKTRANLTEARMDKLRAIDFASLPLKDAIVIKQGTGARKLAVFADPNCGYCKRFERDLQKLKDVTVYTFLYPILGPDSHRQVARHLVRQGQRQGLARLDGATARRQPKNMGDCDTAALERNVAFGKKHRVSGTPAVVFEDGSRVPGAMPLEQVEKQPGRGQQARRE